MALANFNRIGTREIVRLVVAFPVGPGSVLHSPPEKDWGEECETRRGRSYVPKCVRSTVDYFLRLLVPLAERVG
jgi:hypothetical protein